MLDSGPGAVCHEVERRADKVRRMRRQPSRRTARVAVANGLCKLRGTNSGRAARALHGRGVAGSPRATSRDGRAPRARGSARTKCSSPASRRRCCSGARTLARRHRAPRFVQIAGRAAGTLGTRAREERWRRRRRQRPRQQLRPPVPALVVAKPPHAAAAPPPPPPPPPAARADFAAAARRRIAADGTWQAPLRIGDPSLSLERGERERERVIVSVPNIATATSCRRSLRRASRRARRATPPPSPRGAGRRRASARSESVPQSLHGVGHVWARHGAQLRGGAAAQCLDRVDEQMPSVYPHLFAPCDDEEGRQPNTAQGGRPLASPPPELAETCPSLRELYMAGELEWSEGERSINVYTAGGRFGAHKDHLALTVLVPLTAPDEFTGGGTGFWAADSGGPPLPGLEMSSWPTARRRRARRRSCSSRRSDGARLRRRPDARGDGRRGGAPLRPRRSLLDAHGRLEQRPLPRAAGAGRIGEHTRSWFEARGRCARPRAMHRSCEHNISRALRQPWLWQQAPVCAS